LLFWFVGHDGVLYRDCPLQSPKDFLKQSDGEVVKVNTDMSTPSGGPSARRRSPSIRSLFRSMTTGRTHARVERLLSLASDFQTTVEENQEIAKHLESCAECRAVAVVMRATRGELRSRPISLMPQSLANRLSIALAEEKAREQDISNSGLLARRPARTLAWSGGALAAAACTLLAFMVIEHKTTPPEVHPTQPITVATAPAPSIPISHAPVVAVKPSSRHSITVAARPTAPAYLGANVEPSALPSPKLRHHAAPAETTADSHSIMEASVPPVKRPTATAPVVKHEERPQTLVASLPKLPEASVASPLNNIPTAPMAPAPVAPTAPVTPAPAQAAVPTPAVASYTPDDSRAHLSGTLRLLARETQSRTSSVTTIALAGLSRRPDYTSTVSMVSASVH
jgi:hypothetical protein